MNNLDFCDVFRTATRFAQPYAYQCRLACGPEASPGNTDSLRNGAPYRFLSISAPTGLCKTAGVVLAQPWEPGP